MTNKKLVEQLKKEGYIKTPIIEEAFLEIDRANFLPKEKEDLAYINQALPIGEGQTISQPLTVAFMLELLEPKTGEKILDVGTGSGWQASLLAYIVSNNDEANSGKIISLERIEKIKKESEKNINKYNFINEGIVEVLLKDANRGHREEAPYDKIISAASSKEIPESWKKQLKVGGKIVAPIESSINTYTKKSEKEFEKKQYFGFSFVPLLKGTKKDK